MRSSFCFSGSRGALEPSRTSGVEPARVVLTCAGASAGARAGQGPGASWLFFRAGRLGVGWGVGWAGVGAQVVTRRDDEGD